MQSIAGKFGCDTNRRLGARCYDDDNGTFGSKYICETSCRTAAELGSTYENIKSICYDHGYKFPVPDEFLRRIFRGDLEIPFREFIHTRSQRHLAVAMRFAPNIYANIVRHLLDAASILVSMFEWCTDIPTMGAEVTAYYGGEVAALSPDERAELNRSGPGIVNINLKTGKPYKLRPRPESGIDIIDFTYLPDNCTGTIVVIHADKRIFIFGPPTSGDTALATELRSRVYLGINQIVSPLREAHYTYGDAMHTARRTFDDNDPYCVPWGYMISIFHIVNSSRSDLEVLNYTLAVNGPTHAIDYVNIFAYFAEQTCTIDMTQNNIISVEMVSAEIDSAASKHGDLFRDRYIGQHMITMFNGMHYIAQKISAAKEIPASAIIFIGSCMRFFADLDAIASASSTHDAKSRARDIANSATKIFDIELMTLSNRLFTTCAII